MARRIARRTALTPDFDWRTRDDVLAALSGVRHEPLPDVQIASASDADFYEAVRAFKRAYGSHPVVAAAETWSSNEIRTEGSFRVFCALVNLNVQAARRWYSAQSEPAPF